MRDRFQQLSGKTRFVVCRIFLHLAGREVAPLLGVLNQAGQRAIAAEGDLDTLGEELVTICDHLLEYEPHWQSAANEGDVFWDEGEAGDYVTELFTDSAQRYGSGAELLDSDLDSDTDETEAPLILPITQNLVVMITVAYEGEVPALETDLTSASALRMGLKSIINLHHNEKLRAIQVHFSPAQLGDELTYDELLQHYPELVPL
ncbi:MAG: DUF1517 domain-containing protein [Cyanobacteriota bacterium]